MKEEPAITLPNFAPEGETKKKRGRPPSGNTLSAKERMRKLRAIHADCHLKQVTLTLSDRDIQYLDELVAWDEYPGSDRSSIVRSALREAHEKAKIDRHSEAFRQSLWGSS